MKLTLEILRDFYIQRIFLYSITVVFSLLVIIPLGDLRNRFTDDSSSHCVLYSDVVYVHGGNKHLYFKIRFGKEEVCEYNIAVSSVFCLFYPLAVGMIYFFLYHKAVLKEEDKKSIFHIIFLIHVVLELVMILLVLVSACMISAGFQHLCHSIVSDEVGVKSCRDGQNFANWRGFDGSNFYVCLTVATVGSWLLFVTWILQGIMGVWKIWKLNIFPAINVPGFKEKTVSKVTTIS